MEKQFGEDKMSEELSVDSEFSELGWPLSDEERRLLTENLKQHGCQETIKVWANHDNTILDGHNRYSICQAEDIPYKVKAVNLKTRQDCIDYICNLQLGRRNSSDEHKAYLRGKRYLGEKRDSGRPEINSETVSELSTAADLAAELGVTARTLQNDAKYAEAVDELSKPVKDAVLTGEVKTTRKEVQALAELPKSEQKAAVAKVKSGEAKSIKDAIKKPPGGTSFNPGDWEGNGEKPAEILDGEKNPVPEKFRGIFVRAGELTALEQQLQAVAKKLDDSQADPLYTFIHAQSTIADIDNAKRAIRFAKPFAVCKYCKGAGKSCKACKGQGWLPKSIHRQPAEARK